MNDLSELTTNAAKQDMWQSVFRECLSRALASGIGDYASNIQAKELAVTCSLVADAAVEQWAKRWLDY